jgi:hypothetical protein
MAVMDRSGEVRFGVMRSGMMRHERSQYESNYGTKEKNT